MHADSLWELGIKYLPPFVIKTRNYVSLFYTRVVNDSWPQEIWKQPVPESKTKTKKNNHKLTKCQAFLVGGAYMKLQYSVLSSTTQNK